MVLKNLPCIKEGNAIKKFQMESTGFAGYRCQPGLGVSTFFPAALQSF
jgi:hypothetical protein